MKTSRKDGILALQLGGQYEVAVDGSVEKRSKVVCRDITSKAEGVAFDLEQMIFQAAFDVQNNVNADQSQSADSSDDFYKKESPSQKEVADHAFVIEMMINSSTRVSVSAFLKQFQGILDAGLVESDSGAKIYTNGIWDSIGRHDKAKIAYSYCAFFVNPLARLSDMNIETADNTGSAASKGSEPR